MIGNLSEVGCAMRLDRRPDQPEISVAIEILVKVGLEQSDRRAGARHPAHIADSGDVVAVVAGTRRRINTLVSSQATPAPPSGSSCNPLAG